MECLIAGKFIQTIKSWSKGFSLSVAAYNLGTFGFFSSKCGSHTLRDSYGWTRALLWRLNLCLLSDLCGRLSIIASCTILIDGLDIWRLILLLFISIFDELKKVELISKNDDLTFWHGILFDEVDPVVKISKWDSLCDVKDYESRHTILAMLGVQRLKSGGMHYIIQLDADLCIVFHCNQSLAGPWHRNCRRRHQLGSLSSLCDKTVDNARFTNIRIS